MVGVVMPIYDIVILAVWLTSIGVLFSMQWRIWNRFVKKYPHLHKQFVPGGSAFVIPAGQFIRACKSVAIRRAFMSDRQLRISLIILLLALCVLVLMIPTMLSYSTRYF